MCSPPATIGMLGKRRRASAIIRRISGQSCENMQLTPMRVGVRLDPLDDLFAAQADGGHLVGEQRRDLKRVLPEPVDDACGVAGLPQACRQIGRADGRGHAARSPTTSGRAAAAGVS